MATVAMADVAMTTNLHMAARADVVAMTTNLRMATRADVVAMMSHHHMATRADVAAMTSHHHMEARAEVVALATNHLGTAITLTNEATAIGIRTPTILTTVTVAEITTTIPMIVTLVGITTTILMTVTVVAIMMTIPMTVTIVAIAVVTTTLTPTATAGTIATKRMTSTAEAKIYMTTRMMRTVMTTNSIAVSRSTAIMKTPLFPSSAPKSDHLPRQQVDTARARNPTVALSAATVSASWSVVEGKSEAPPRNESLTHGAVTGLAEAAVAGDMGAGDQVALADDAGVAIEPALGASEVSEEASEAVVEAGDFCG